MADTFVIRDSDSEDWLPAGHGRMEGGGGREARCAPRTQVQHDCVHFFIISASLLHWTTAIMMVIFSIYILVSEYALARLADLDLFSHAMLLHSFTAGMKIIAAAITTSLLTFDNSVPKRTTMAALVIVITAVTSISVIITALYGKDEIHNEVLHDLRLSSIRFPSQLRKESLAKGHKCESWEDNGCQNVYKEHVNMYSNFLLGFASIALAIDVITLPIYVLEYKIMKMGLKEGNTPITNSRNRLPSSPSRFSLQEYNN